MGKSSALPDIGFSINTDITQEAERVIKSICYEQFRYSTTACDAILLDWFDLPQFSNELSVFGFFGASRSRPTLPGFVFVISVFKTAVGMAGSGFSRGGRLFDN